MKTKLLFMAAVFMVALSGCKKDLATVWIGTYNGTAGSNTFNQVVINKVNDNTLKLEFKTLVISVPVTYATVASGKLNSPNVVTISEDGTIAGYSGTWHFTGSGTLSGNTLSLNGAATQTGQSTLYYTFNGSK